MTGYREGREGGRGGKKVPSESDPAKIPPSFASDVEVGVIDATYQW